MKVKFIKYHPLFAYSVGDVGELNDVDTDTLISEGFATPVVIEEAETADSKMVTEKATGKAQKK